MDVSIFEIAMLLCFGAAWPVSLYKSFVSRTAKGKSIIFLYIIVFGYVLGILHKLTYDPDFVMFFYGFNGIMVAFDIGLWYRNRARDKTQGLADQIIAGVA